MRLRRPKILPAPYTNYKSRAATHLAAQHIAMHHIYNDTGVKENIDTLLKKYPDIWPKSLSNEIGRLTQGV